MGYGMPVTDIPNAKPYITKMTMVLLQLRPRTGIITSIQNKGYVEKEKGKGKKGLIATPFGLQIYEYLEPNFKEFFMDVKYTSKLEEDLDKIENGEKTFLDVVDSTYQTLQKYVKDADGKEKEPHKSTGEKCKKCKKGEIVEKTGRFGAFFSCNNYPDCKAIYVQGEDGKFSVKEKVKLKKVGSCEKCGNGNIVERTGQYGLWYACDGYPKCKTVYNKNDDGSFAIKTKNWKKKSS
jgi:DNA topoisomerase-1